MDKHQKKNLKNPDLLQHELQKGFQWTTQHSKMVIGAVAVLLLVGGGFATKSYLNEKAEEKIQAKYFPAEKAFLDLKQGFLDAEAEEKRLASNKDPKNKTKQQPNPKVGAKATGDYEKDFGPAAKPMEEIISEAPRSKAAKMAALNLAQVQIQYKKLEDAKNTLTKVSDSSKDLLSAMVQGEMGTLLANQNDCKGALTYWEQILNNKKVEFMHSAVRLKMGLCFEAMNEIPKAEEAYNKVKEQEKDSSIGRSAEKYLRLLQVKKI